MDKKLVVYYWSIIGCLRYYCSKENNRLFVYMPNDFNYISLYVFTLFPSCFEEIKGTDIKETQIGKLPAGSTLHTAQQLLISEELDFITIKMAEIQQHEKVITISNDKSTSKGNRNLTYELSVMGIAYTIKTNSNYRTNRHAY